MSTSTKARLVCAALLWVPGLAWGGVVAETAQRVVLAQADAYQQAPEQGPGEAEDAAPTAPDTVPAPPAQRPQPPGVAQAPSRSVPPGQWVHTDQYGWIWMPYGEAYTYSPPDGYGEPYMYVYYPVYGWTWLVAPWVWGFGPWPHFGLHGPSLFAWYRFGWWRSPWRFHFASGGFRGGFGGFGFHRGFAPHGARPAPPRGGWAGRGTAGGRGFAVHGGGAHGRAGGSAGGHGRR